MTASSGVVQFGSTLKATRSQPAGRVCESGGCETVLSIYNHSAWCYVHEQPGSRGFPPASSARAGAAKRPQGSDGSLDQI